MHFRDILNDYNASLSVARPRFDSQFQKVDAVEVVDVSRTAVGVRETEPMVTGGKVNPPRPLFPERVLEVDVTVQILEELFPRLGDFEERPGLFRSGEEPFPGEMASVAEGDAGRPVNRYGQG